MTSKPLLHFSSLQEKLSAAGGRVRYSALDVSRNYIICGANTGSLYLYTRACAFVRLITLDHADGGGRGEITHVRFSADEKYVAICTAMKLIFVLELKVRFCEVVGRVLERAPPWSPR
jgi:hypothetical protein